MVILIKGRRVTQCPGQSPSIGLCQKWPPNNPHTLKIKSITLLTTQNWCGECTGAVVLWLPLRPSRCCTLEVEESPDIIVKCFVYSSTNERQFNLLRGNFL